VRPCERDQRLADGLIDWWERGRVNETRPFFAFALLDSPHQTYDFPEETAPFRPFAPELDYIEMAGSSDAELVRLVRNRYQNALHHADSVAGRILDALTRLELDSNTLVIVTGDHGEEFAEHGHWGHTSCAAPGQSLVPFLLRGPGVQAGRETRATSHLDVACTLLELLGADPTDRSAWSVGTHLLSPDAGRLRTVSGWEEIGLWTSACILRIPFSVEADWRTVALGYDWRLVEDQPQALRETAAEVLRLREECYRFLRRASDVVRSDG
jgi:membrane-anchored protein YejM (alkaline phosphatase superfamily)